MRRPPLSSAYPMLIAGAHCRGSRAPVRSILRSGRDTSPVAIAFYHSVIRCHTSGFGPREGATDAAGEIRERAVGERGAQPAHELEGPVTLWTVASR